MFCELLVRQKEEHNIRSSHNKIFSQQPVIESVIVHLKERAVSIHNDIYNDIVHLLTTSSSTPRSW